MKLVSRLERDPAARAKDATDIRYIIESYSRIPEIHEALFDEGLIELPGKREQLARDAARSGESVADCERLISVFLNSFSEQHQL